MKNKDWGGGGRGREGEGGGGLIERGGLLTFLIRKGGLIREGGAYLRGGGEA